MRAIVFLKRLGRSRRATALTEFAILLPVLLTLYLGGFQIADAASCSRRVTTTSRSMADLVSQYANLDPSTLDSIINASQQMMAPYRTDRATIRVSQVSINRWGMARVSWSDSNPNIAPYAKNKDLTAVIPPALLIPNSALIYSEVSYPYAFSWNGRSLITLSRNSFMLPRRSATISLSTPTP